MSSVACPGCGTEYAPTAIACPHCLRLVHADELKVAAAQAEEARGRQDKGSERAAWESAIPLLPPGSKQRQTIEARIAELSAEPTAETATPPRTHLPCPPRRGAFAALALVLWKAKGLLLLALGKLKFLTAGLGKASTFFSFLAAWGVYWSLWGWRFALGFLFAMYIHEMGHVAALRRYGIPASAPMFIPGLGAFVRMKQHPATVGQDARIGLAGPAWGLGAALAAYVAYGLTGAPIWAAIGHSAAFLNLFNLLPVWQLDGGRGFAALTRGQRLVVTLALGIAWGATGEGVLGLIAVVAAYRALFSDIVQEGDTPVLAHFVFLIAAFSSILILGKPM
jgi:Zn-dependent protease